MCCIWRCNNCNVYLGGNKNNTSQCHRKALHTQSSLTMIHGNSVNGTHSKIALKVLPWQLHLLNDNCDVVKDRFCCNEGHTFFSRQGCDKEQEQIRRILVNVASGRLFGIFLQQFHPSIFNHIKLNEINLYFHRHTCIYISLMTHRLDRFNNKINT